MQSNSKQPTILITGGTGFAGSHLIEALVESGYTNVHTTTYGAQSSFVAQLLPAAQIHQLNLLNKEPALALIADLQPDQIYHLAALAAVGKSFNNIKQVLDNNTQLQLNLLEAVRQHASQARVLVVGSAMEYDLVNSFAHHRPESINETHPLGPVSPYAVSKVVQDLLANSYGQSFKLSIIRVRPFNHIGERQNPDFAIPAFAQQIVAIENKNQAKLKVGNLESVRDFTDVKDMVRAYMLLMEKGEVGRVYNVGSGVGISIQQILEMMIELASSPIKVELDQKRMRPIDAPVAVADPSLIHSLGWQPRIELKDTLQRILNYWRENL